VLGHDLWSNCFGFGKALGHTIGLGDASHGLMKAFLALMVMDTLPYFSTDLVSVVATTSDSYGN